MAYWYQAKIVTDNASKTDLIFELGPGTGFLSNYLKMKGYNILTLDIDREKSPDVVIDALHFHPLKMLDYFCAFEVFEHLPYAEFEIVIKNLSKCINKGFILSLPIFKKTQIELMFRLGKFRKHLTIPTPKNRIIEPHHHWELGYKEFTEDKLIRDFQKYDFHLNQRKKYLRWRYFFFEKV